MGALFAGVVGVFGQLGPRGPDMYRPLFVLYALIGLLNPALFIGLSDRVESAKIHGAHRFIGIHRSAGVVTKLSLLMSLDAFARGLGGPVVETVRHTLNVLAEQVPEWLLQHVQPDWVERYRSGWDLTV